MFSKSFSEGDDNCSGVNSTWPQYLKSLQNKNIIVISGEFEAEWFFSKQWSQKSGNNDFCIAEQIR